MLLTERFDEGLALLQKMLDWDPIDMTYCRMLQTKKGESRWDGKPLENVPRISELSPEVCSAKNWSYHRTSVVLVGLFFCLQVSCSYMTHKYTPDVRKGRVRAWSIVKGLRQATNEYSPPSPR